MFEEQKLNPLFTLVTKKLPENFNLADITGMEIVPWMKMEDALKINFKEGEPVHLRLQWYSRKKLEGIKQQIEQAQKELEVKRKAEARRNQTFGKL